MSISSTFDRLHSRAKQNSWLWLFSVFNRVTLAFGFIAAGIVKITDERFASGLSVNHPMGHYLEALHLTGYYYTFVGIAQIAAAVFLLIPRTVTLGAFIYFPIIFNIWILTYATRFEGSMLTAPLMTLANLYILGWNYEKWKYILPFNDITKQTIFESYVQTRENTEGDRADFFPNPIRFFYTRFRALLKQLFTDKFPWLDNFPWLFFAGVFAAIAFFGAVVPNLFSIVPRNKIETCRRQFDNTVRVQAGENFCGCIHKNGEPLNKCLDEYNIALDDAAQTP